MSPSPHHARMLIGLVLCRQPHLLWVHVCSSPVSSPWPPALRIFPSRLPCWPWVNGSDTDISCIALWVLHLCAFQQIISSPHTKKPMKPMLLKLRFSPDRSFFQMTSWFPCVVGYLPSELHFCKLTKTGVTQEETSIEEWPPSEWPVVKSQEGEVLYVLG